VPRFVPHWQVPAAGSDDARTRFRRHPSGVTIASPLGDEAYAFVVEVIANGQGRLLAIRIRDGELGAETQLAGPGVRFAQPLVHDDTVYVSSCGAKGGGQLEAYRITPH